jgi:inhibitor of KinA
VSASLVPAGDVAILVELDEEVSEEVNARVRALERLIAERAIPGVLETVPAFRSLLVYYDPLVLGYERLCEAIVALAALPDAARPPAARQVELPCCYEDAELGFELATAAERLGLDPEEVVRLHTSTRYPVYFLGFAPGQPYLCGTPERLRLPRLPTPRTRTPAGSVGIAGEQCCIYSVESPGGFWVLGRTPVRLYDPSARVPVLLQPGDCVSFRAIGRKEYDRLSAEVAARTYRPAIA